MIDTIIYKGMPYPKYIIEGNAASYIFPFAAKFCTGSGYDIGGTLTCTFPGAVPINLTCNNAYNAYNLPEQEVDYIFSSHTLEHLPNFIEALTLWKSRIKNEGVLFLYLPHPDMEYWLPQNNRKHLHSFTPEQIHKILFDLGFKNIFISGRDLYWSFAAIGENCK